MYSEDFNIAIASMYPCIYHDCIAALLLQVTREVKKQLGIRHSFRMYEVIKYKSKAVNGSDHGMKYAIKVNCCCSREVCIS